MTDTEAIRRRGYREIDTAQDKAKLAEAKARAEGHSGLLASLQANSTLISEEILGSMHLAEASLLDAFGRRNKKIAADAEREEPHEEDMTAAAASSGNVPPPPGPAPPPPPISDAPHMTSAAGQTRPQMQKTKPVPAAFGPGATAGTSGVIGNPAAA